MNHALHVRATRSRDLGVLSNILHCKEMQPVNPKGNQSWIFIGRTDAEAETPYFSHLMWRTDSLEKTLMLGKIEGRRRGQQRIRWLDGITYSMDISLRKLRKMVKDRKPGVLQSMGLQRVRHDWATELNWNEHWKWNAMLAKNRKAAIVLSK